MNNKMGRILQVNKLYEPHIGGVETIVRDLAQGVSKNCEVEVLVCQPRGKKVRETVNGVVVTRAASVGIWRSMPVSVSFPFLMRAMARRFDLIHLHHPFPLGEVSALAFANGQRLVFTW